MTMSNTCAVDGQYTSSSKNTRPPGSISLAQNTMNTLDDLAALDDPGTEGTIVADSLGRVQTLNRSAELIFGYPKTELINRELHLLMPDAGRIQTNNSLEHVASGHAVDGLRMIGIGREVKGRRKDGSTIELELTMFDLRGVDGLRYSISAIRDVTQRNLQVRDLQSAIEEAKQARMDAERANRAKSLTQKAGVGERRARIHNGESLPGVSIRAHHRRSMRRYSCPRARPKPCQRRGLGANCVAVSCFCDDRQTVEVVGKAAVPSRSLPSENRLPVAGAA